MKHEPLAGNPFLKKLIKEYSYGDILFSEGSPANTVLLILSGSLQLTRTAKGTTSILATLEAGEFIGEKALLQESSFKRAATATALSQTAILELGPGEFATLEVDAPQLYSLLLKKAFKTLVTRNERIESMNNVLREFDPQKRFLLYMHFLAKQADQKPQGKIISVNSETVGQQLNLPQVTIDAWVMNLIDLKLISKDRAGLMVVPDENAFLTIEPSVLELSKAA